MRVNEYCPVLIDVKSFYRLNASEYIFYVIKPSSAKQLYSFAIGDLFEYNQTIYEATNININFNKDIFIIRGFLV